MGGMNGVKTRSTKSELQATARRIRVPVSRLSNSFSDGGIGPLPSILTIARLQVDSPPQKTAPHPGPPSFPRDPSRREKSMNGNRTYKRACGDVIDSSWIVGQQEVIRAANCYAIVFN